jgi:hypothetical protein
MKRLLVMFGSVAIATLFSCCVQERNPLNPPASFAVRYHARDIDVWGPFADKITLQDIEQIRERIRARRDIHLPVSVIHTLTENSAEVTSGIPSDMEKPFTYHMFIMRRQNNAWAIDSKTVKLVHGGGVVSIHGNPNPSFQRASD